jgi:catechol 2,3-dioxygenase-like lactoylglutathione lyase family enzyme
MFDHVTLRVPDLPEAERRFQSLLDQLSLDETFSSRTFALWGDFALTEPDDANPLTRRAHVAFVAPSREAVDAYWQAGVDAGFRDDGPPGPRRNYSPDYYAAFLRDAQDNSFEAVHRDGMRRGGNIDHVAVRVADVAAAAAFYRGVAEAAGIDVRTASDSRFTLTSRASGGLYTLLAGPVTEHLHVAFPGDDDAIRRFYETAVAAGYRGNGEPGERPRYHPGYYAAYIFDPDGNNIEIVDHHRS